MYVNNKLYVVLSSSSSLLSHCLFPVLFIHSFPLVNITSFHTTRSSAGAREKERERLGAGVYKATVESMLSLKPHCRLTSSSPPVQCVCVCTASMSGWPAGGSAETLL